LVRGNGPLSLDSSDIVYIEALTLVTCPGIDSFNEKTKHNQNTLPD